MASDRVMPTVNEGKTALVYCQRWKLTSVDHVAAGFTLHVDKQRWKHFMKLRAMKQAGVRDVIRELGPQYGLSCTYYISLNHMGILNLEPDGNPYWCEISADAKKRIGFGHKFSGIAPLPRYIYRWELRMRKITALATVYVIPRLKSAFFDRNCAEVLALSGALRTNQPVKEYPITQLIGLGPNALTIWAKIPLQ